MSITQFGDVSKSPLTSKTLWLNVIAIAAMLGQSYTGFVIGPEYQASALGVINLVLRAVTKVPLNWSSDQRGHASAALMPLITIMLLTGTLLSGCANWQSNLDDPMTELVVRATTARVLAEHPGWTGSTVAISGNALMMIDGDPLTSLDALQQSVVDQIDWHSLVPEEQALLQVLITRVRVRLEEKLGETGMTDPGQYMLPVKQLLLWINQTAALRI
ncbi:MAG: hypothetical protein L3J57_01710 [Desulfuromusa sp.]|nr:hypothetical protein [Desulfuromusa sp.]